MKEKNNQKIIKNDDDDLYDEQIEEKIDDQTMLEPFLDANETIAATPKKSDNPSLPVQKNQPKKPKSQELKKLGVSNSTPVVYEKRIPKKTLFYGHGLKWICNKKYF